MKEIAEMEVTQYRLFAPGRLPYKQLCTQHGFERLQEVFAFRGTAALPGNVELIFEGGTVSHPERTPIGVTRLQVSDRRVVIAVSAESAAATHAFEALRKVLTKLDPSDLLGRSRPVSFRQETSCVATLDVRWEQFFDSSIPKFLTGPFLKAASDKEAAVRLTGLQLRFSYAYEVKDETISQYGVTLAPKKFIIEPQKDTPLTDRRYFTTSPTDSDTHLRLVSDFERLFL